MVVIVGKSKTTGMRTRDSVNIHHTKVKYDVTVQLDTTVC